MPHGCEPFGSAVCALLDESPSPGSVACSGGRSACWRFVAGAVSLPTATRSGLPWQSVRVWRTIVANLSGLREFPSRGLKNEPKRHIFPGPSATAQRRPARSAWFQRMIWRLNRAMDCSRRRRPVVCQVAPPAKVRACRFAMAQGSPWIWSRLPLATARQPFWQEPSPAFQSGLQKERDLTGRPHRRPTPL